MLMRSLSIGFVGTLLGLLVACGGNKGETGSNGEAAAAASASEAVTTVAAMKTYDAASLKAAIVASPAKVTLVALWATWCAPCIEEMPALNAFYEKHRAAGVRVIGLCTDDAAEMGDKIQGVLDKTAVGYAQALLKPGSEEALLTSLGETWDGMLPKTLVLGPKGDKLAYFGKAIDAATLESKVAPLLSR